jgi:hypothetical protein
MTWEETRERVRGAYKRRNAGKSFPNSTSQVAFSNAIVACLVEARELSLDAIRFPAKDEEQKQEFLRHAAGMHDRLDEQIHKLTGQRWHLPRGVP